jgi:predicted dehydrogenase
MAHFVDVARGRTPPLVSLRDGLDNLRVTEAVMQAAHSGHTVPLN